MFASWIRCELLERSQAEVYLAVDKETGKLFVVKTCDCDDKRRTRELLNEITIFLVLESPRVVQYLGSSFTNEDGRKKLNLFLEYMPGGSLRRHIDRLGGRLEESLIKTYTRSVVEALHHLHKKGIVHGDIKADNILVGPDGLKLCDFGGSKFLDHETRSRGAMRGTPAWMAPEVVAKLEQGFPSDIWSLGCTVIEMASGQDPWGRVQSKLDLRRVQLSRKIPDVSSLSPEGQRFAKRCLVRNPKQRWTAAQLLDDEEFIMKEVVDVKIAAMSPALARVRATFPDPPAKSKTTEEVIPKPKPKEMPPKITEKKPIPSKLAPLPTSVTTLHLRGAEEAFGIRPPDESEAQILRTCSECAKVSKTYSSSTLLEPEPSLHARENVRNRHGSETLQDGLSSTAVPVSELMQLQDNARDSDKLITPRDRLFILLESEPILRGSVQNLARLRSPRDHRLDRESEIFQSEENAENMDNSKAPQSELESEPSCLWNNDRDMDSCNKMIRDRQPLLLESEQLRSSGEARNLDMYTMSYGDELSKEYKETPGTTSPGSSKLREPALLPVLHDFSNHSPALSELQKLREPWEIVQNADSGIPLSMKPKQSTVSEESAIPLRIQLMRSLLQEVTFPRPQESKITAVRCDHSDHSRAVSELEQQHETREAKTMDGTLPLNTQQLRRQTPHQRTPSDEEYFPLRTPRNQQTRLPCGRGFLRDHSDHKLCECSDPPSTILRTPSSQPNSEISFRDKEKASELSSGRFFGCCIHWRFNNRRTSQDSHTVSMMAAPSPASDVLSDYSDHSATLLGTYTMDNNTRRSDQKVKSTCPSPADSSLESRPSCESTYLQSSSSSPSKCDCSYHSSHSSYEDGFENPKYFFQDEAAYLL